MIQDLLSVQYAYSSFGGVALFSQAVVGYVRIPTTYMYTLVSTHRVDVEKVRSDFT